ncbi:hypothetical protein SteCoe_6217 [Stentor coeruleus]|uniref:EF-hand domain-containing protein n=1 Tax=Stentor coeruleus TaxID=5963 RepID=A0A1R2CQG6_9CILI|nr:hypothetical protein SteCoe_6217 [Stentor coeruleus]
MGCTHANTHEKNSLEKAFISLFEQSLGFTNLKVADFNRIILFYSDFPKMSTTQFFNAFQSIQVAVHEHKNFYEIFLEDNLISARKICCLGILLCNGEVSEKVSLIFDNYDKYCSGSLSINKTEEMIYEIVNIVCSIIPKYVLSLNRTNQELRKYVSKLSVLVPTVVRNYITVIMGNSKKITKANFIKYFSQPKMIYLLNPSRLRSYTFKMFRDMVKPALLIRNASPAVPKCQTARSKNSPKFFDFAEIKVYKEF